MYVSSKFQKHNLLCKQSFAVLPECVKTLNGSITFLIGSITHSLYILLELSSNIETSMIFMLQFEAEAPKEDPETTPKKPGRRGRPPKAVVTEEQG